MKIIVARRGRGKTSGCVEYLRQHPHAYLVVHSKGEVLRVRQQYTRNESEVARRIVSFEDVVDAGFFRFNNPCSGLVIDNADLIMERVFEKKIEALAVSWPEDVRG